MEQTKPANKAPGTAKKKNRARLKIKSWAEQDRPREKLLARGPAALSDAELLGLLIGSGTLELNAVDLGMQILESVKFDLVSLSRLTVKDLLSFRGIGQAKAIAIMSALELGRRRRQNDARQREPVRNAMDTYQLIQPYLMDLMHEEFWIVLLNRCNIVVHTAPVSSGGLDSTVADPRVIFRIAVQHSANAIIMIHNHPSGNLQPSQSDILLTRKLSEGGRLLDLRLADHLIVSSQGYYSFAETGML